MQCTISLLMVPCSLFYSLPRPDFYRFDRSFAGRDNDATIRN